jgi:hypothetical protein
VFVRVLPKVYPSLSPSEQERQDRFSVALRVIFEYSQYLAICFNLFVKIFVRGLKGNISNKINNFFGTRESDGEVLLSPSCAQRPCQHLIFGQPVSGEASGQDVSFGDGLPGS